MTALTEMPHEVLLAICVVLSVKDVIRLAQTCRRLFVLESDRHVWADQLKGWNADYGLSPAFDVRTMSLKEIQAAVGRPCRFERILLNRGLTEQQPVHLKASMTCEYQGARLVPGGRWLVVLAKHNSRPVTQVLRVQVLDLQRRTLESVAEAAFEEPIHVAKDLQLLQAEDRKGVYIFVYGVDMRTLTPSLHVLLFTAPQTKEMEPTVAPIFNCEIPFSGRMVVQGPMAAFQAVSSSDTILVDWQAKEVREPDPLFSTSPNAFKPDYVISMSREHVTTWTRSDRIFKTMSGTKPVTVVEEVKHKHKIAGSSLPCWPYVNNPWLWDGTPTVIVPFFDSTLFIKPNVPDRGHPLVVSSQKFRNDNRPLIPSWNSPKGRSEAPSVITQTIGGHFITISSTSTLTVFHESEDKAPFAESYKVFPDIQRHLTPTECPFMCAISGTIGFVGREGDVFLYQQK